MLARHIYIFIFAIIFLAYNLASAKNQSEITVDVDWYKPQFVMSIGTNKTRVFLTGKTLPGASVTVHNDELVVIGSRTSSARIPYSSVIVNKETIADPRGFFDLPLDLTLNAFQIPVEVKYPTGESRVYILPIVVKQRDVTIADQTDLANSPFGRRNWSFWAGAGFNLLMYEQSNSTIGSDLRIDSLAGPSLHFKSTKTINRQMALSLTYNRSPGKTASSESVQVAQDSFDWIFYTAEANYFPPTWKSRRFGKYFTEIGAQLGLQQHKVPFMARTDPNDPATTSVTENTLTMLAGGLTCLMHYNRYFMFEGFVRYQYPLATGSLFEIEPQLAFDGSVGVVYKWKKDFRIGGFWYGQYHKYNFSNHNDIYFDANPLDGTNPTQGAQSLFFTNLELRLGWEFD